MHLDSKDKCLQTLLDCWDMISEGEIFCYLKQKETVSSDKVSETVYNNFVVIVWHEETGSTWIRYQKPVIMIFALLVKTMVLHAQLVSWPADINAEFLDY